MFPGVVGRLAERPIPGGRLPGSELAPRIPLHEVGARQVSDDGVGAVRGVATQGACSREPWPEHGSAVRRQQLVEVEQQLLVERPGAVHTRGVEPLLPPGLAEVESHRDRQLRQHLPPDVHEVVDVGLRVRPNLLGRGCVGVGCRDRRCGGEQ
jgi:hypothetical protein